LTAAESDCGACAQHAIVAWLREHADLCEVIHGHEWGGVLVDAVTLSYFRRLPPGTRSVIVPHGGHMWSLQWRPQRSLSVEPLRIDHQVFQHRSLHIDLALLVAQPITKAKLHFHEPGKAGSSAVKIDKLHIGMCTIAVQSKVLPAMLMQVNACPQCKEDAMCIRSFLGGFLKGLSVGFRSG
jgi:hypothetical protein